jgi:hypothetical protein
MTEIDKAEKPSITSDEQSHRKGTAKTMGKQRECGIQSPRNLAGEIDMQLRE